MVPVPHIDAFCGRCTHDRDDHRRGWGPCTFEACTCRRFAISTYTEGPRNGR